MAIAALGEIALSLGEEDESPKGPRASVVRAMVAESHIAHKKAKLQEKADRKQRKAEERERKKAEEKAAREAAGRLVFDDEEDEDDLSSLDEEEMSEAELMSMFEGP